MVRGLYLAFLLLLPLGVYAGLVMVDRGYGVAGRGYDYVLHLDLPPVNREVDLPDIAGPPDASRPLVVIDPGHGGHDPGASYGSAREKLITLRIARAIRDELVRGGGIRVALTREEDRYLVLGERSTIARRLGADLFLSIHADAAENAAASGASVYVLSARGSSEAASRIAERQNASDRLNGVVIAEESDAVSSILLDLSQREAQAGSEEMAGLILRELDGEVETHTGRVQSAAFVVLKAPDVPSVLFETGYLSNGFDAAYLQSPEGVETLAKAASRAIRAFFARQSGA